MRAGRKACASSFRPCRQPTSRTRWSCSTSRASGIRPPGEDGVLHAQAGRRHGESGSDCAGCGKTGGAARCALDRPVQHVRFEGIAFRHGGWLRPSKIGHCNVQANFIFDSDRKDSFARPYLMNVHSEIPQEPGQRRLPAAKLIRFELHVQPTWRRRTGH